MPSYFYGSFNFIATDLFRNAGQYTTLQSEAYQANMRLAEQLQRILGIELRSGLVRPAVSTGRLEKALLDSRNRVVSQEGFGVGLVDYLDSSQAKYYRQIDAGTQVHVGQKLHGLWSAQKRFKSLDPYDQAGPVPRGAYPFDSGISSQEFFPVKGRDAVAALKRSRKMSGRQAKKRSKGVIRRAIEPEDYFYRSWTTFDAPAAIIREYDRVFRAAGFRVYFEHGLLRKTPLGGSSAAGRRQDRGV